MTSLQYYSNQSWNYSFLEALFRFLIFDYLIKMNRALSKIDKIILLCKNVDKTASIYSQTLGLRVFVQSAEFVELRDSNNTPIYLQQSRNPAQLSKGYSPILSFNVDVQKFDLVYQKLMRYELIPDGDIIQTNNGKLATFLGPDGETISINDMKQQEQMVEESTQGTSIENEEIKRILQKIKL